jgi:hypothetical protein
MTTDICGGDNVLTATSESQQVTSRSLVITERTLDAAGYNEACIWYITAPAN